MTISKKTRNAVVVLALFIAALFLLDRPVGDRDVLYQVSVLNGLMRGDYDGKVSLREIRRHGNFGIGTFDKLDGEAIEIDGVFYQASADGVVHRPALDMTAPFAMVVFFYADSKFTIERLPDVRSLQEAIDKHLVTKNRPCAIRVDGKFSYVKVRSVPPQAKPYQVLSDVTKGQSVFEFRDVEGTLIAFRIPDYMAGVNLPGFHMHFLSRDKTKGGHLLDCELESGDVMIDVLDCFRMELPKSQDFDKLNLSTSAEEVLKVEAGK